MGCSPVVLQYGSCKRSHRIAVITHDHIIKMIFTIGGGGYGFRLLEFSEVLSC